MHEQCDLCIEIRCMSIYIRLEITFYACFHHTQDTYKTVFSNDSHLNYCK